MNRMTPNRMQAFLPWLGLVLGTLSPTVSPMDSLGPGVWADSNQQRVYLSNASGQPEARQLLDARLLWRGNQPVQLLYPIDDQWLALGQTGTPGSGKLLLLSAQNGAVMDELLFDLPAQVNANVLPAPLQQFDVVVRAAGQGLQLHWQFVAYPLRGALLQEDGNAIASDGLQAQGVFDIHLQDARLQLTPRADLSADLSLPDPLVAAYQRMPELRAEVRQFRSADGLQTMQSQPVESAAGLSWRWEFASTGASSGPESLELPFAYAPFLLVQSNLLYRAPPNGSYRADSEWQQAPARLVLQRLDDGAVLWSTDVLDRVFRGTLPP